ncbi:MAG: SDR family oxidoreductase [Bryobacteraceae bacterium]|nr:SDR family oxidoreductase [Bryobacteraceae bacterium]MDW8378473.1 SDR family oxidoreductase [Bryobacterales bacterium]
MANPYLEQLFSLSGQIGVVIGGTGVLGGAMCEGLARAGAHVVVAGRSRERGEQRVASITAQGGSAEYQEVDVTERASIEALRDRVVAAHGKVDILVNCAGVNSATPYEEIRDEDWDRVFVTNLKATHWGCQLFAPLMASQPDGGSIVNIGSVTAHLPLSRVFAYSASKAAVVNLSKNVAREYAQRKVRVNTLCPGFFPAEQNRKILDPTRVANILSQTPMGRFGEPQELVGALLLLCSRVAGSFMTGAEIYVDGGFTANRF